MLWEHCYCSENNYNIPVNRERWACNRRHALSSRLIVSLSDSWRNPFNDQHCDVRWSAADTIFNVRTCWVTSRLSEFIWADRLWTSSLLVWCNSSLSRTARHYLQKEYSNIFFRNLYLFIFDWLTPAEGDGPPPASPGVYELRAPDMVVSPHHQVDVLVAQLTGHVVRVEGVGQPRPGAEGAQRELSLTPPYSGPCNA